MKSWLGTIVPDGADAVGAPLPTRLLPPGGLEPGPTLLGRAGRLRVDWAQGLHGPLFRLDLHERADLLQSAHDHPFVRPDSFDHAQAVRLQRARGDAAVLHLVLVVEHVNELDP